MPSGTLVVRPVVAEERGRFDEALRREHWLGAGLVGEVMRYVATEDGEWCALVGFGSAALCVRPREELLGWSDSQRYRRLRYVTNNQRFCVLEARRRPNLASEVLGATSSRLSSDFRARWGHPVVMVETFTDPARHVGTCYQASNFTPLGATSGYGRRAGRFVHHGATKAYWYRALRRDALGLLSMQFDHPALCPRRDMAAPDLNLVDLTGLLGVLGQLPDTRKRRGVRHRLPQILAIAVLATLRGATSLFAIGEVAAELPPEALERLGCRVSPSLRRRVAPEESTVRRALKAVDAGRLDAVVNAWLAGQVTAGRLRPGQAPEVNFSVMVEEDGIGSDGRGRDGSGSDGSGSGRDGNNGNGSDDNGSGEPAQGQPRLLPAVAVDGKTLRGARPGNGRQVHLLSALTLEEGVTVAQAQVDGKTNEITVFRPVLERLDLPGMVVTADAMHTQREHARFLVEDKGAHWVFGLKDNQPTVLAAAEKAFEGVAHQYETHDRAHGRTEHRYYAVVGIDDDLRRSLAFPYAANFVRVHRERYDLAGVPKSNETSYYITDLRGDLASIEALAYYVRGHWGIENRSHYVRDRTFDEDRCQVRTGGAPQVLATLRNLAISILRLVGFKNIAAGTRWAALMTTAVPSLSSASRRTTAPPPFRHFASWPTRSAYFLEAATNAPRFARGG
jgi:predicted transposase YbfD/YdcC